MKSLEGYVICHNCGSLFPDAPQAVCDYCIDKAVDELYEKYREVLASGGPEKNSDLSESGPSKAVT